MTKAELQALPPVINLPTAARALGLGRAAAYRLARNGEFPCTVLSLNRRYRVVTAGLLQLLGLPPYGDDPARGHRTGRSNRDGS